MRRLFLKINAMKGGNPTQERLENAMKLMSRYDQVLISFEGGSVNEIFEILRQMICANVTSTLMVYFGKKTCPEGYDEISV
jgi:hypothetical protein